MLKTIVTVLFVGTLFSSIAQTKEDVVFGTDYPEFFLGIDFSNAVFPGSFRQFNAAYPEEMENIKTKYFDAWNNILINERNKYNVPRALRRRSLEFRFDPIRAINATTDVEKMKGEKKKRTTKEVQKLIKKYDLQGKEGIGYLFFVDYLDADNNRAGIHFLAINLKNNKIIIDQFMESMPGGAGIRNYWAKSFYTFIRTIELKYFGKWKKEVKKEKKGKAKKE